MIFWESCLSTLLLAGREGKQVPWELVQLFSLHESEVISTICCMFKKEPNIKYFIMFSSKANPGLSSHSWLHSKSEFLCMSKHAAFQLLQKKKILFWLVKHWNGMSRGSVKNLSLGIVRLTGYNPVQPVKLQNWTCFEEGSWTQTSVVGLF